MQQEIDLRAAARSWRSSSKARSQKLGITLVTIPSIDEVHIFLQSAEKVCLYCGIALNRSKKSRMQLDHKQPVSRGGTANTTNLALTCGPCNRAKGEMSLEEYQSLRFLVTGWEDGGKSLFVRLRLGYYH